MKDKNIKEISLAQILCTKLCHDLAGPITGIYNGTELLEESDEEMKDQALELISSSSKQAAAKLKILRQAYGSPKEGSISIQELQEIYQDYFGSSKTSVEWAAGLADISISALAAKLLSNVVLSLAACLPLGGRISVSSGNGGELLSVDAVSEKIRIDEAFEQIFFNKKLPESLETKNIHYFYTSTLAEISGASLDSVRQESSVRISFPNK